MEVQAGKIYKNIKNKQVYKVLGFALHTETEERMVIYENINVRERLKDPFARPLELFKEKFETIKRKDESPDRVFEEFLEKKIREQAKRSDVPFEVKIKSGMYGPDILIRINKTGLNEEEVTAFTDAAHIVIVPRYAIGLRYSYPTHLKLKREEESS